MKKALLMTLVVIFIFLAGCSESGNSNSLIIYSGRSEKLVAPIIDKFEEATGIEVEVRYGGTAEMAATLLEEGQNSPADLFWAQDPGGLGAVAEAGMLAPLPEDILNLVPAGFQSPNGNWVGISGRARVVVYNTSLLTPEDIPDDIWDFTDPAWSGRIGWAPTNGSFQVMVTAMRSVWGEEMTADWLKGIIANEPLVYENNTAIVSAVGAGEVEVGFTNHYYLYRFLAEEGQDFEARNVFLSSGGPGSLVMVAGAGILESSSNAENAAEFLRFLLSESSQIFFATETYEYPMLAGVALPQELAPLDRLSSIKVDLAGLNDLAGTVALLQSVGALP